MRPDIRRSPRPACPGSQERCRGCRGPRRRSGLSRSASRYSAIASSSFPWSVQGIAEVVVGLGIVGLEPQRRRGTRRSPRPASPVLQSDAEVAVGLGMVGLEPQVRRGTRRSPRPAFPGLCRAMPRLIVGLGVVGLEPQRFAVLGDRLVQLPLVVAGRRRGCCGLRRKSGLSRRPRGTRRSPRPASPGSCRAIAEVVVGLRVVGLERGVASRIFGDRLVQLSPCASERWPRLLCGRWIVGLEPHCFAVLGDRLVQLPLVCSGRCRGSCGHAAMSGLSRSASRYSAIASSSFPWSSG